MPIRNNNPHLPMTGFGSASSPDEAARLTPGRAGGRPILGEFPVLSVLQCWFRSAPTTNLSLSAAGLSAWFGLGSWRVPDTIGGQAVWSGTRATLGPTNSTGNVLNDADFVTAGANTSWGLSNGTGAAIVVGVNLPCRLNTWLEGPSNIPLVEPGSTVRSGQGNGGTMQVFHFAPGLFTTNPMPRIVYNPMTSPMVTPLVQGSRLDVALVVRGSQIVADNRADGVVGYAHVELILGLANSAAGWDS